MKKFIKSSLALYLLCIMNLYAITVVECEDPDGNRSFQAFCQPDSTIVNQKKLQSRATPLPNITPIIYLVTNCRACDGVRNYFQDRDINVLQKNIENNIELQNELKEIIGNLKVPTVVIDDKVFTDYKPDVLTNALKEAGFSDLDLEPKD